MKLSTLASIMWFLSLAVFATLEDELGAILFLLNGFAWIVAMITYKEPPEDC